MIVDSPRALEETCLAIRRSRQLGIDTETNGLHAYKPSVCIIQISNGEREWIVDALAFRKKNGAGHELDPLLDIFADPSVLKILHGASHDIASLKEDFGRGITNLFDTYIAAQLLDYPKTGLSSLVEKHFGVALSKKLQKADWAERPLSDLACEYLRHDVSFLLELYGKIRAELAVAELVEEAELESRRVEETAATQPSFDPEGFWRISGLETLTDSGVALLHNLYRIRDDVARQENRPPFKMIPDPVLIAMAGSKSRGELARTEFLHRRFMKPHIADILAAFDATRNARRPARSRKPTARMLRPAAPDRGVRDQLEEALKAWRREEAARRRVSTMAVLPNHILESLVFSPPSTVADLAAIPWIGGSRASRYGAPILELVRKATARSDAAATLVRLCHESLLKNDE